MQKKRKRESVFRQLVVSFILFAVIIVLGAYVFLFIMLLSMGGGSVSTLAPYELVDENGSVQNYESWSSRGGWIEKLDENYQLLQVFGTKKDDTESYSQEDIYEYLNTDTQVESDTSASVYRGFLKAVREQDAQYYYLMKIERNVMRLSYTYNVGSSAHDTKRLGVIAIAYLLFFAACCYFMSRYLARKIQRPLQEIVKAMKRVIEDGAELVQLDFQTQKEFEEIRDSFNVMTRRLEEEKRAKQISEAKKNRMLLELSHDIKTPVSTIKSYANALQEGLIAEADEQNCYQSIDQKAMRVDVLANEMFLLLKLDSPEYAFTLQKTDICELLRTICAGFYEQLMEKGIEMDISIPEEYIYFNLDAKEFTRVVENLIGNIIKYNQTGSYAWITAEQMADGIEIRVEDDGEAVQKEICDTLFEPFTRGDRARASGGGTGLGLAIAKKIMEKLDGEIRYEYREKRNCFCIRLFFSNCDTMT